MEALLEGTSLKRDEFLRSDRGVTLEETRRVLANGTRHLGPGWHLTLAQSLTIPSHGPLGFAVVTAPGMAAAVNVLLRYISIRGPFLWLTGAREGKQFVIRLHETADLGAQRQALVELALLSIQALLERPLGRKITGAEIAFAAAPPDYRHRLAEAFHARLHFNARRHSLRIPSAWLEEPCVLHDEAMHRYLLARCEEEMQAALNMLPTEIAVRQALLEVPGRMPGLAEIAASQHMSGRTLIRHLKREGTSFHAIRDGLRQSLALDYLQNSRMTVNQIAYRLGYRDPSNFGRAFRKWFGVSPGRYRKRRSGQGYDPARVALRRVEEPDDLLNRAPADRNA
jgi:AraC-like DNA-binding protein